MSQSCSLHSNSLIIKVDFAQVLGPATISVNGFSSFNKHTPKLILFCTNTSIYAKNNPKFLVFIAKLLVPVNFAVTPLCQKLPQKSSFIAKLFVPERKGIKVVCKPPLLKNNFGFVCFRVWDDYANMFSLDLFLGCIYAKACRLLKSYSWEQWSL
jgi:hypothetical protein